MSTATLISVRQPHPAEFDDSVNEARIFRRYQMALEGRFMRSSKQEYPCLVNDISVGGMSLIYGEAVPAAMAVGETVIAYIGKLGVLEGPVLRCWSDGFSFKFTATQHKREKLAAQITSLLNEGELKGAAKRKHERLTIARRDAHLTLSEGGIIPCLILDVSVTGASVACKARPDLGQEVWLARLRARVVRHHCEGVGLQFMEVLDASTMEAYFG